MSKPTMTTDSNGDKHWYLNGQRHRTDGPAIEYADGDKSWWLNGQRHRTDGPAIEYADGDKEWWINDQLHRTDGPAIEYPSGTKHWYLNGEELTEDEFNERMNKPTSKRNTITIDGKKYFLVPAE